MAKPQDKNEKKAKKNLDIDKLEDRVAPAMFGAELTEAANAMDAADSADSSFDDTASEEAAGTAGAGYTGLEVQEPADSAFDLGTDEAGLTDGGFEQSYAGFGSDYDILGGGESVTFSAPEGYTYDQAGILDIPAGETAGAGIAPWPEGTSIDADGTMTFDPPSGFEVTADGVVAPSEPVEPVDLAPFIDDAEITMEGGGITVEAPLAEGVSLDPDGASYAVAYEAMPPVDSAVPPIPGVSIEDGTLNFAPPEGVAYDAEAGTYTFPGELAPPADAPNLPEGTYNDDGSWTVQAPEDADLADDGSFSMPLEELAIPDVTLPSIDGLSMTGDIVSFEPPEGVHYNADAGSYHFPVDVAPSPDDPYLPPGGSFANDGSYTVPAPDGVDIAEDGSFNADLHELMDPAEQLPELEGLSVAGSTVSFAPPEGVQYDADAGTYHFPADVAPSADDPYLPKEGAWNEDGSWTVTAPEGIDIAPDGSFTADYQELVDPYLYEAPPYPEGMVCGPDGVHIPVPDNMSFQTEGGETTVKFEGPVDPFYAATACECDCYVASDGAVQFHAGYGIETDPEAGTYEIHQTLAPEATGYFPPGSEITADGGYRCELPDGYEVHDDGSVTLPMAPGFFTPAEPFDPTALYGDYLTPAPDGEGYNFKIEGFDFAEDGTLHIPAGELPEDFQVLPDGTTLDHEGNLAFQAPEGCTVGPESVAWSPDAAPEPASMACWMDGATIQPDGGVTLPLPEGITPLPDGSGYTCTPDVYGPCECNVPILPGGEWTDTGYQWTPPEDGGYQLMEPGTAGDGYMLQVPSGDVPAEGSWTRADGTELTEDGAYIPLPENLEPSGDGSFEVKYEDPNLTVPYLPEGATVAGGGEFQIPFPDGASYDADAGTIQFPAGTETPAYEYQPFVEGASQDADGKLICPCGGDTGIAPNPADGTWSTPITGDAAPTLEGSYPPGSATLPDGSYGYAPPEGAEFQDDGSMYLPPETMGG